MVVPLFEILQDGLVIGKVTVVHQRLVERAEGMTATGMPHAPARRIALVGQPGVGFEIVQLVVADDVLGIADYFEDSSCSGRGT